jgi:hypothetical protein
LPFAAGHFVRLQLLKSLLERLAAEVAQLDKE